MTRRTAVAMLAPAVLSSATPDKKIAIRGMYSNPKPFWDQGARLNDYGVNSIFVHGGSITGEMIARASNEGARTFAEFPTLNGKGYVEKHPEAWPVNELGDNAQAATWFLGACPTEPGFRSWRMKQLDELLERFDLAGIWLDYFHWHAQFEDPNPILPETCFCANCLKEFAQARNLQLPAGTNATKAQWILKNHGPAWRDWRVMILLDWAKQVKAKLRARRPSALLGVYHCPWTDVEFNGARRRTLGLDLIQLAPLVDVLSPMVYHGRMQRRPEWVGEYVQWLSTSCGSRTRIWPIVQAHNDPREIPALEFEQVLRLGISASASGIMMFTAHSVASDKAKMQVMQRVYREWM